jgi:hypothetical protein
MTELNKGMFMKASKIFQRSELERLREEEVIRYETLLRIRFAVKGTSDMSSRKRKCIVLFARLRFIAIVNSAKRRNFLIYFSFLEVKRELSIAPKYAPLISSLTAKTIDRPHVI